MKTTLADIKHGQRGVITDVSSIHVPLKLLEMGCLPGNSVELVQVAPFADPMYLNINGTHLALRKETAIHILIDISNE
ncbi:FeoA family protein [Psychroserpens sp.]|uniref:FeoA family protein n=1 Tax=Psychroserpens sp. TaxID=2020870 RepID=UPI001B156512|nr:FeoA family protein [Psychroserpens sp.]MBO6605480.1 ferrous iron transport protein A [Psychroserpens sp.]MBO6631586.1 ferrous iron transport protein A [Psychroserpens sp.]MBO6653711.1 ferrous iron transport protein A [Psychroserpens sp.]MBO6682032.1 ferrous iron transport protein A [Psychroserpens sp.]MBO6748854.1 ferrous iron transport protein A [Psychroserpens sp.]